MKTRAAFDERVAVSLHLADGATFRCFIDTGAPGTLLPRSLEPLLGKRLSKGKYQTFDGPVENENIYAAPKIFLGDTPLITGEHIGTWNESYGILGMDCLRNYCMQLDSRSGKMRFLNSKNLNPAELGGAFRLSSPNRASIYHSGLFEKGDSELLIDTGFNFDGVVSPKLAKRLVQECQAQRVPVKTFGRVTGKVPVLISAPACVWEGETYTNLILEAGHPNLLGIKFLARHLVTFDFPDQMMYIKPFPPETIDFQKPR